MDLIHCAMGMIDDIFRAVFELFDGDFITVFQ